jgi:hypothetical protein
LKVTAAPKKSLAKHLFQHIIGLFRGVLPIFKLTIFKKGSSVSA